MNATSNAIRAGLRRGLTEFTIAVRQVSEAGYMLVGIVIVAVVLVIYRGVELGQTGVSTANYILGSVVAVQLALIAGYSLATVLVTEREDGTLLRMKSLPYGLRAYTIGLVTRSMLEVFVTLGLSFALAAIILGSLLGMSAVDVLVLAGVIVLGIVALAPIGFVVGSIFRSPRAVGGWGMVVVGLLAWLSGLLQPLASMPSWAQIAGQVSPLYWVGLGVRSAVLPDELAMVEIDGSWRLGLVFAVLAAWAVAGLIAAPLVLSRAARRESGSSVERRRVAALQRV